MALEEIRAYPRVKLDMGSVVATVLTPDLKQKSRVPAYEISKGGILLPWKDLPTNPGAKYPIVLDLGHHIAPIPVKAEFRYELSRGTVLMAGFKFMSIAKEYAERLDAYIATLLHQDEASTPTENTLSIVFRSPTEWKREFELNISHGAMFVHASVPFENQQTMKLALTIPGRERPLLLEGRVIYCWNLRSNHPERRYAIGVRLDLTIDQLKEMNLSVYRLASLNTAQ